MIPSISLCMHWKEDHINGHEITREDGKVIKIPKCEHTSVKEFALPILNHPVTSFFVRRHAYCKLPVIWHTRSGFLRGLNFMISQKLYYNNCAAKLGELQEGDELTLKGYIQAFDIVRRMPEATLFTRYHIARSRTTPVEKASYPQAVAVKEKLGTIRGDVFFRQFKGSIYPVIRTSGKFQFMVKLIDQTTGYIARPHIREIKMTESGKTVMIIGRNGNPTTPQPTRQSDRQQ